MLMDSKGLGKPSTFSNELDKYPRWARSVENYVVGVFGEGFRTVIEWAAESEQELTKEDVDRTFGDLADELDRIDDVHHKCAQWYLALVALTEDESQDIVLGAGPDHGAEAWRKLTKRWDPIVAGRNRALLKAIIGPERCKLEELVGVWEKWEASIPRYERRKDESGNKLRITGDFKMTAFESLLPPERENHLVLNKKRLDAYEAQKEEIEGILDSRIGAKIKELAIKPTKKDRDAMDVDYFGKSGKGKGKSKNGKGGSGNG